MITNFCRITLLLIIFSFISSCILAPEYKTPKNQFEISRKDNRAIISSITWDEYFVSPDLQNAIKLALENNRDLEVANLNIAAAKSSYKITRSDLIPKLNASAGITRQGFSDNITPFGLNKIYNAGLSIPAFELDFFGKLRSLKKSAWESYLSTIEAKNITRISIITETANAYTNLVIDKEILDIYNSIVQTHEEKYQISKERKRKGIDSAIDVLNAKTALENAKSIRDGYKATITEDKTALAILVGTFDKKTFLPKANSYKEIDINDFYLQNTPSEALLSRPDIAKVEHDLRAANANIGAARAAFFPSISITANTGYVSTSSQSLFSSLSNSWSYAPQINIPIFAAGANSANLELSKIRKKIEITNYEKAIETAFKEAVDAVSAKETLEKQLESSKSNLSTQKDLSTIAILKYFVGSENRLSALDDRINYLNTKQTFLITKKAQLSNLISLYKILGGGSEMKQE